MFRLMKVLSGVFIFRRIATADIAADQAHAQMDPRISQLNAFVADMLGGFSDFDLIEVSALFRH